jgi:thiamine-phosphate pyrophosphorylase
MKKNLKISGGVYLVLDPAMPQSMLLDKLRKALEGGVQVLQIWNNWPAEADKQTQKALIREIISISSDYDVPILINEEWKWLRETGLSGIHFDQIPANYEGIKSSINREFIAGITCGNDLGVVEWAEKNQLDYISFCAIFPSSSVYSCEIVRPETIKKAREITSLPLFLSGGITPQNISGLKGLDFSGVAVISGIMNADHPKSSTTAYTHAINQLKI